MVMYNFYIKNEDNTYKRIMSVAMGSERTYYDGRRRSVWDLDDYESDIQEIKLDKERESSIEYNFEVKTDADMRNLIQSWRDRMLENLQDKRSARAWGDEYNNGNLYVIVNGQRVFDSKNKVRNITKKTDDDLRAIVDRIPFEMMNDTKNYELAA